MSERTSDDYLKFGTEYTSKILNELQIDYVNSKIDGYYIAIIDKNHFMKYNWISYFFNFEYCKVIYDNIPFYDGSTYNIPIDNHYYLKIINFSNDNWKNYKKLIRKKKINILNSK